MPCLDLSPEMNDFIIALGLERADIQSFSANREDDSLIVTLTLNRKEHLCPFCMTPTSKVKDYRLKKIRHSVLNPTPCIIHYKARRYFCPICRKAFYEHNPFSSSGSKVSIETVYNVLNELRNPASTFSSIAQKYHLSPSSVSNLFDKHVTISRRTLPECLSFDEVYAFKSHDSDYICVLLDYTDKKITDILPSRKKKYLINYFSTIPLEERKKVRYCSFDMWKTYRIVSKLMFPNCICIVDKFHLLQELMRRVERVRVDVMNKNYKIKNTLRQKQKLLKENNKELEPDEIQKLKEASENYYLLKKFNFVLYSNNQKIHDPNIPKKYNSVLNRFANLYDIYDMIINMDEKLNEAINIRDRIHHFYSETTYEDAKRKLEEIIVLCRSSNIVQLQEYSKTLIEWKQEIINSFIKVPTINKKMNNALIENRNKSIKLLKHSSNGYTNWDRFRNRVLFCLNEDSTFKI